MASSWHRQDRLSVRPQRLQGAAGQARPEQIQWWCAARPEGRGCQKPWRNQTPKALPTQSMLAMRWSAAISSPRSSAQSRRQCTGRRSRRRLSRDCDTFGRARLRLLFAGEDADQCRIGDPHRYVRRVDRAAHRHPPAPRRRRGRVHLASGDQGCARGAASCEARRPGDRPDRAGDLDAGQHLSGDRGRGAGRARHQPRRRLRPAGGLLRLRLCAGDRRQFPAQPAPTSARW